MAKQELTQERLKQVLNYDPDTGVFTHKVNRKHRLAGDIAGGKDSGGYWRMKIDGKTYRGARLAWLYVHGVMPGMQVDHRNRVRSNDRILNLRLCPGASENHENKAAQSNNTTGFVGVSRSRKKMRKQFQASISKNGKKHFLGYFLTAEEAGAAYIEAKKQIHTFNPILT